jgi:hypothetical protein
MRILDALGRGLLKEFPNPERAGCPGSDVLKRIASHEMPLPEAEKWLDHVTSCSPCYSDFSQYQAAHQRRRTRTLLAMAASILIAIGIAGWVLLQKHNESMVAQTAVLDLRNRSIPRGTEPNPGEPPLEINHVATYWNIYLPLGSSEGEYDIRIVTPSGELLFAAGGTAKLTDHITSLQIPASLSSSRSGSYVLQIRKTGSGWTSYPLQLR